jgi:ABC-2 type transport system permease protein
MRSFVQLYMATVREFARDKSALFWTFAFPLFFIVIFGIIFSGDQSISFKIGLVNEDGAASTQLVQGFKQIDAFKINEGTRDAELKALKNGDRSAVIIIPAGTGAALGANNAQLTGGRQADAPGQAMLDVYYDPANQSTSQIVLNVIDKVVAGMNEGITGVKPALTVQSQTVTTSSLSNIDYLLPGVLAMSLMQLGLFATAAPLVSLREKGVLRRMGATPLSKTTLLSSQVAFRLTTAFAQTGLIVLVGVAVFNVHIIASHIISIVVMVLLGATLFITMGYFLSGVAKTEEAVNGLIQLPNITFMFLSGIFFPVDIMPAWIRPLVDVIPLTYVGDALRKTMLNAGSYFSMTRNVVIMLAWLVVCGLLAVKFFRWETEV